jgi:TatD DNase family protein
MPWIIHGFRGKPQLARQLINQGFYISLGELFNPQTATIIPTNRLLFETDESTLDIDTIIERIKGVL